MLLTPRTILQSVIRRNFWKDRPNMPMTSGALKILQGSKKVKRARQGKFVPAHVSFQVVGNGAPGCSKSVYLHTDHNRYLFNCGEMSQKVITEHVGSNSLGQMTNIFVTSKTWNNIGGLPGMCLSIRAAGSPDVKLHGPLGIMKMYEATEKFVILFDFDVIYHDPEKEPLFEDGGITVQHIPLRPDDGKPFMSKEPKYCKWLPDMDFTNKGVSGVSEYEIDPTVYAYVVTIKGRAGKINMEKCKALGIRPGPMIGILKAGNTIKLENGNIVKSEDVTEDPEGPSTYIVIDCPSKDYVPSLLKEPLLQTQKLPDLCGIFHFSPIDVVNSESYVNWVNSLPEDITHIMLNQNSFDFGTTKLLKENAKLHTVAPEVFSKMLPGEPSKSKQIESNETASENVDYKDWNRKCIQGATDMKLSCRPDKGSVTWNKIDPMELFDEEIKTMQPELDNVLKTTREAIEKSLRECTTKDLSYPKVTFLGTGSSVPSKYRNASCILVEVVPDSYVILDCGEGSLNQLVRLHGFEKARKILRNLKAIYISHLHADHHLGLINLVLEREKSFAELNQEPSKVYIMAPARIANYLSIYHQNFQPVLTDLEHISNEKLLMAINSNNQTNPQQNDFENLSPDDMQKLLEHVQLKSVKTCRVFHCPSAFAVSLTTLDGYKIVYSGDTRPTENIISLGQDEEPTDLLIHEATMEHHMLEDAQVKRHTTFTEAVKVAQEMKAKNAIMTHFSQRYAKIPTLEEFEVAENVGIAFDFTTVTPKTVNVIQQTYPALKILFKEAINDVRSRKDVFKFKKIDETIEASLNMERSFENQSNETFGDPRMRPKKARLEGDFQKAKISNQSKQKEAQEPNAFSKRYANDNK